MILQLASYSDVHTLISTRIHVVLLGGRDPRLLGGSVRARNTRVASRVDADVLDPDTLPADSPAEFDSVVLVPATVALDPSLFPLPELSAATVLETPAGARLIAGPWRDVEPFAAVPHGAATLSLPRLAVAAGSFFDVSTADGCRTAGREILLRTGKPTDGWVSRNVNRPISRVLSYGLLGIGLSAWHASVMTLIIGILGAIVAAQPGYAAFVEMGVLFQIASILDGVDGEMARATLTESEAGARLDTIIDQITYISFFVGVTIGWAREGGSAVILWWTVLVVLALLVSLLRGARFVSLHAPDASWVFIDRSVRRAAQDSGQMPLRAAASLFVLLRRDAFAVIFMLTSLTGRRAFVPFMVAFGAMVANFTFSYYNRELAAAAARERSS
jgi:phosphatidylglycerophosphate synthase